MDIANLLRRCVALERGAAEVYDRLAGRCGADPELRTLWCEMAADEREHAHKLDTWCALVEREPPSRRPQASGFEEGVAALEALLQEAQVAAQGALSPDDAFAVALALETSELDVIYTTLLHGSPVGRFPDLRETMRRETSDHHERLITMVRRSATSDANRLRAAILERRCD